MIIISIAHPMGDYNCNKAVIEDGRSERITLYICNSENNQLQAMNRMWQIGRQQLLRMRIDSSEEQCVH
jgi:hypothetical protein